MATGCGGRDTPRHWRTAGEKLVPGLSTASLVSAGFRAGNGGALPGGLQVLAGTDSAAGGAGPHRAGRYATLLSDGVAHSSLYGRGFLRFLVPRRSLPV